MKYLGLVLVVVLLPLVGLRALRLSELSSLRGELSSHTSKVSASPSMEQLGEFRAFIAANRDAMSDTMVEEADKQLSDSIANALRTVSVSVEAEFDPSRKSYLVSGDAISLRIPALNDELRASVQELRVRIADKEQRFELTGTQRIERCPIPPGDQHQIAVSLVTRLGGESESIHLENFSVARLAPLSISLRQNGEVVKGGREIEVDPGDRLVIRVDGAGEEAPRVRVNGRPLDQQGSREGRRWSLEFAASILGPSASRAELEVVVRDDLGKEVPALWNLWIAGNPIKSIRFEDRELSTTTPLRTRPGTKRLIADLTGLSAAKNLQLFLDGKSTGPASPSASGSLEFRFTLEGDGDHSLEMHFRRQPLESARWSLVVDGTAPTASLTIDGKDVPPGERVVDGAIEVTLGIEDAHPIAFADQQIEAEGFSVIESKGDDTTNLERRLRLDPARWKAHIRFHTLDGLGNRGPELEWRFTRKREALSLERVQLDSQLLAPPRPTRPYVTNQETSQIRVRVAQKEGQLRIALGADANARSIPMPVFDGEANGSLEWGVPDGAMESRRVIIRDQETDASLLEFDVVVDRKAPEIAQPSPSQLSQVPGTPVIFVVRDASGLDEATTLRHLARSAKVETLERSDELWRFRLIPTGKPTELNVLLRDKAGNPASCKLSWEGVPTPPPVEAVVAITPAAGSDGLHAIRNFSELRLAVRNGELQDAYFEGRKLQIGADGSVATPPLTQELSGGALEVRYRSASGNRSERYRLRFIPFELDANLRTRLEAARGDAAKLKAIDRELQVAMKDYLRHAPEVLGFRSDLGRALASAQTPRRDDQIPPQPPRNTDPKRLALRSVKGDGAELALVQGGGKAFLIYVEEVNTEMFRSFAETEGLLTAEWWKDEAGMRSSKSALEHFKDALKEAKNPKARRGAVKMHRDVAQGYLHWLQSKHPNYEVRLPTVEEWRLAAGRAKYPEAIYPTTPDHPKGEDLNVRAVRVRKPHLQRRDPAQPFGLYDMAGCLPEWASAPGGKFRIIGGSFDMKEKKEFRLDEDRKGRSTDTAGLRPIFVPR